MAAELGLEGGLKTSGSSGIHVYLPLPPKTPLEAATLVAQIVATRVAVRFVTGADRADLCEQWLAADGVSRARLPSLGDVKMNVQDFRPPLATRSASPFVPASK